MLKEERAKRELEALKACMYAELYQGAATLDTHSLERLCRRIHVIELKIYILKGVLYEK